MEALSVVDGMADPAFAVDGKYRLVAWNKGVELLLGRKARSVLGKRCYQVICGTDVFGNPFCAADCPVLNMARHGERAKPFDLNLLTTKSKSTRFHISTVILGRTISELAILHYLNLSGLKTERLSPPETEIQGAGKRQHPAVEIIPGLTHEIRNNLQMIIGEIEILNLNATASSEYLVILNKVGEIDRLLREANEYFSLVTAPLSVEDPLVVLKDLQRDIEKDLAGHGIHIDMDCKDTLPRVLVAPKKFREAVRQVVDFSLVLLPNGGEVLLNARQKTVSGTKFVELSVTITSESTLACEGMDVFQPFLRVNNQRVGLSMAVAQEVLRRQHGSIIFRKESQHRGVFSILMEVCSH
jgi:nitrogen-specific signal transduction histidine kinase